MYQLMLQAVSPYFNIISRKQIFEIWTQENIKLNLHITMLINLEDCFNFKRTEQKWLKFSSLELYHFHYFKYTKREKHK